MCEPVEVTDAGLVIFDCDGVLVDSEHLVQRIEMALIAELGWPITVEEVNEEHLGRSWPTIQANIERRIGRPLPRDFRQRAMAGTWELFERELKAVAGIQGAIDDLHRGGYATCVTSSGSHARMRKTLGLTGLWNQFEGRIFSSEDVARGKPEPDLFLHAASRMGYPPPRCVVVEDSPAGVAAAHTAGMTVVGYAARTPRSLVAAADVLIDEMSDLPDTVATHRER